MEEERKTLRVINDLPGQTEPEYFENEIVKENKMLELKFQDLMKEISEKTVLMDEQITNKDNNTTTVEDKIQKDIAEQEVQVKGKTDIYLKQTEKKKEEEKELLKILKDYRQKFTEFDKANKKTKDYYKNFEKEIRALDSKRKDLERQKELLEQKTKKGGKKGEGQEDVVEKMQKQWDEQKATFTTERDQLKEHCARLQEQIKAKTK